MKARLGGSWPPFVASKLRKALFSAFVLESEGKVILGVEKAEVIKDIMVLHAGAKINEVIFIKREGLYFMKAKNGIGKAVAALTLVVLIGAVVSIPLVNNHTAHKVETALLETPLPEKTELIESISRAGKLAGNGNGMQYFGAVLIKSELSLEELDAYYSDYRRSEWEYLVEIQEGQSIEVIDHEELLFSEEVDDSCYYILYSWGSGSPLLRELDVRGR